MIQKLLKASSNKDLNYMLSGVNLKKYTPEEFVNLTEVLSIYKRKRSWRISIWPDIIEEANSLNLSLFHSIRVLKSIYSFEKSVPEIYTRTKEKILNDYELGFDMQTIGNIFQLLVNCRDDDPHILEILLKNIDDHPFPEGSMDGEFIWSFFKYFFEMRIPLPLKDLICDKVIPSKFDLFYITDKINISYYTAALQIFDRELWEEYILKMYLNINYNRFTEAQLMKISWSFLILKLLSNTNYAYMNTESYKFLEKKFNAYTPVNDTHRNFYNSEFQKIVTEHVKSFEPNIICEYSTNNLVVDIMIPPKKIIEIQGPYHYINNKFTGLTHLKKLLLQQLGFDVHSISYLEWRAFTKEEKDEKIKSILKY